MFVYRHVIARIVAVDLYIAYVMAVPQCGFMALAQASFGRISQQAAAGSLAARLRVSAVFSSAGVGWVETNKESCRKTKIMRRMGGIYASWRRAVQCDVIGCDTIEIGVISSKLNK